MKFQWSPVYFDPLNGLLYEVRQRSNHSNDIYTSCGVFPLYLTEALKNPLVNENSKGRSLEINNH